MTPGREDCEICGRPSRCSHHHATTRRVMFCCRGDECCYSITLRMLGVLTLLVLVACGGAGGELEDLDAGERDGSSDIRQLLIGDGMEPLELLEDAGLDGGELEDLDAGLDGGELEDLDAGLDGGALDAGPCDGGELNGCGGCSTLQNAPGVSCAGDLVGSCGLCNWATECVYECAGEALTVRVCPRGLESCNGRP